MDYISSRGKAVPVSLETALLQGLAPDGGLYIPETLPHFSPQEIAALSKASYQEIALKVLSPFLTELFSREEIAALIQKSYASFEQKDCLTVRSLDLKEGHFYLAELFHGPTLAFKDFALQLLASVLGVLLERKKTPFIVLGATSGDTGSAAIAAFKNLPHGYIVILHPHQGTSLIQRKQMTTTGSSHVINLAIKGNFDDCQRLVKACFNDKNFRKRLASELIAVNSITWLRIVAQTVYYFFIALRMETDTGHLQKNGLSAMTFSIPTGNFGNILAGFLAYKMGLPIKKLIVATNANDVLYHFFRENEYAPKGLHKTHSPSMDITTASNFERLLYYALSEDSASVAKEMSKLEERGRLSLPPAAFAAVQEKFYATTTDNATTLKTIEKVYHETGLLIDPHTAVGVRGALDYKAKEKTAEKLAMLATAHPAKFSEVMASLSPELSQEQPVLRKLDFLHEKKEDFQILPNDLKTVQDNILALT